MRKEGRMWFERLAREIRELGRSETTTLERALDQTSRVAALGVPGGSAALVVLWRGGEGPGGSTRHVVADYGTSPADPPAASEHENTPAQGPPGEPGREMVQA